MWSRETNETLADRGMYAVMLGSVCVCMVGNMNYRHAGLGYRVGAR